MTDQPAETPEDAVDPAPDGVAEGAVENTAPDADGTVDLDALDEGDEVDVEQLLIERAQFLDAYQRTAADFDNFRKQSQKRLEDEVARTIGSFVEGLLPVLDTVEGAMAHSTEGVDAIAIPLLGFLEKEGLELVRPTGELFDPNVAEAVMHEPGEGEPTVTEVLRTGYVFRGRVLRPTMVKVSG